MIGSNLKILLVEDNEGDIFLIRRAIESMGRKYLLSIVRDGQAALEYLQNSAPTAYPDLIILDINLPRCDGKEFLARLQGHRQFSSIPVFVLTSSESPQDHADMDKLGVVDYLIKPLSFLDYHAILQKIEQGLSQLSTGQRVGVTAGATVDANEGIDNDANIGVDDYFLQPVDSLSETFAAEIVGLEELPEASIRLLARQGKTLRLLYVEDCPETRLLVSHLLENAGFEVKLAEDANAALTALESSVADQEEFDIILLDLGLPEIDGIKTATLLRKAEYSGVIVAVTAHPLRLDEKRCLEAGIQFYLPKSEIREKLIPAIVSEIKSHTVG